jgi:hypothetical protein
LRRRNTIIIKNLMSADRHWWLMPTILVTQEAEITRILVASQPRETVHKTLSGKYLTQKGLVEWLKI